MDRVQVLAVVLVVLVTATADRAVAEVEGMEVGMAPALAEDVPGVGEVGVLEREACKHCLADRYQRMVPPPVHRFPNLIRDLQLLEL